MIDEREQVATFFADRSVAKQRATKGYRYLALVDDSWDLVYEYDPYAKDSYALLSIDLGLLPFDEGKMAKAVNLCLQWNHYCIKRHPFALVFVENGHRINLLRLIGPSKIDTDEAQKRFRNFVNAGRQAVRVLREAKVGPPPGGSIFL